MPRGIIIIKKGIQMKMTNEDIIKLKIIKKNRNINEFII